METNNTQNNPGPQGTGPQTTNSKPSGADWRPPHDVPNRGGPFPEPPQFGINQWIFRGTCHCKRSGLTADQAAEKIRSYEPKLRRPFKFGEVERAIAKVFDSSYKSAERQGTPPKWPEFDPVAREKAIASAPKRSVNELRQQSNPLPESQIVDSTLDVLFTGNPLLCIGGFGPWNFGTVPREDVRGQLEHCTLIVPSAMSGPLGQLADGSGLSAHTLENTGPRQYIVVEFDDEKDLDSQAALLTHLGLFATLVCVVFSGGKSLHGWFHVQGAPEWQVLRFFSYAVKLGADSRMWVRSQFARLPGGWNHDKDTRQELYFLKPSVEIPAILLPPPGAAPAYPWQIKNATEVWTNDPLKIANLSARSMVHGFLRDGDVATLVGGAKTLKTWLTLWLAICVALGIDFLGKKTRKSKVLYIDYELRDTTFQKRLSMLAKSAPGGLVFQTLRGQDPLPTMLQIEEMVLREGVELLVLDSLYRTGLIREENSNDSTSQDLTVLQQLAARTGATILVVDHTAKGGGSDRSAVDASRGASSKGGFFDAILVLRPGQKSENPDVSLVTMDAVLRDWPALKDLPVIAFEWGINSCTINVVGSVPQDDPHLTSHRVLEVLQAGGRAMGIAEIIEGAGLPETTIRTTLKKLEAAGRVVREPDPAHSQRHLYRVVAESPEGMPGA